MRALSAPNISETRSLTTLRKCTNEYCVSNTLGRSSGRGKSNISRKFEGDWTGKTPVDPKSRKDLTEVEKKEQISEFEKQNNKVMEWFKGHQEDLPNKSIFPILITGSECQ